MSHSVVVELLVVDFHELCGVGDGLIVLHGATVRSPLHVDVHLCLLRLSLLGCDKNHTSGTTGTVEGGRSSVLQHGDALDIILWNVGEVAAIRSTVDNHKGFGVGIHRGDTTDVDGTLRSTWLTARSTNLQTRDGTNEGVGYVGGDFLAQFLRPHHGGRTCKR